MAHFAMMTFYVPSWCCVMEHYIRCTGFLHLRLPFPAIAPSQCASTPAISSPARIRTTRSQGHPALSQQQAAATSVRKPTTFFSAARQRVSFRLRSGGAEVRCLPRHERTVLKARYTTRGIGAGGAGVGGAGARIRFCLRVSGKLPGPG